MKRELFGLGDIHIRLRASVRRAGEMFRGLLIKSVFHFKSVKHRPRVWETLIFADGSASCNCYGWREYRTCWHTSGRRLPRFTKGIDFDKSIRKSRETKEANRAGKILRQKPASKYVKPTPPPVKPKWIISDTQAAQLKQLGYSAGQIDRLSENGVTTIIANGVGPRKVSILPSGDVRVFP
jgi:hypothetical protein